MHLKVFLKLKKQPEQPPKNPKKPKKPKETTGLVFFFNTFFPTLPAGRAPRPAADYQPRGRRWTVRRKRVPQSQLIAQLGLAALLGHEACTGSFFTH
jgi:hypothetical protein